MATQTKMISENRFGEQDEINGIIYLSLPLSTQDKTYLVPSGAVCPQSQTLLAPPPEADFTFAPSTGDAPLTVTFTDASTGIPHKWAWDFGDGGTSTDQNPSHTFTTDGTYSVSLTVTNYGGSDTDTQTLVVTIAPPEADFTFVPLTGDAPLTVAFTDASTGNPTEWSWDFDDGGSSTDQNPSHTFTTDGTYSVSLTVTNYGGSDTDTQTLVVTEASEECWWDDDFSGTAIDTDKWTDVYSNVAGDGTIDFGDSDAALNSKATLSGDFSVSMDLSVDYLNAGGFYWEFYAMLTIGGSTIYCSNEFSSDESEWTGEYLRSVTGAGSDTESIGLDDAESSFFISMERDGTDLTVTIDTETFSTTVGTGDATILFGYYGYDENNAIVFGPFGFSSGCPEEPD